jgi:hypothetical protein
MHASRACCLLLQLLAIGVQPTLHKHRRRTLLAGPQLVIENFRQRVDEHIALAALSIR